MEEVSDAQLAELETLAYLATPGKRTWKEDLGLYTDVHDADGFPLCVINDPYVFQAVESARREADMALVARLDKDTVLSLVAELRRRRAQESR